MRIVSTSFLSAALLSAIVFACMPGHAQTYTFDSGQADFEDHFFRNDPSDNGIYVYPDVGIGGSDGMLGSGTFYHLAVWKEAIAITPGTTVTTSIFARFGQMQNAYNSPAGSGNAGQALAIGLFSEPTANLQSSINSLSNLVNRYSVNSNDYGPDAPDGYGDATPTGIDVFGMHSSNAFAPDDWYKFSMTYTFTDSSVDATALIEDFGTTGTELPTTFMQIDAQHLENPLSDGTAYVGINGGTFGGSVAGAQGLDNFSVQVHSVSGTPEPGSLILVLPVILSAASTVRRKRA